MRPALPGARDNETCSAFSQGFMPSPARPEGLPATLVAAASTLTGQHLADYVG